MRIPSLFIIWRASIEVSCPLNVDMILFVDVSNF